MMKKKKGRIINITSVVGLVGNVGQANYKAAKAGVIGLTKTVAKEYSCRNITVQHMSNKSPRAGRRLEELWDSGIHVNDTVTVSPYGSVNFSTINDAIAFAPNNSVVDDGYFIIYAKQGYDEEYVVVPRHKKNIMLIGDGINATVITGNRSGVDGWTTFNSATFGAFAGMVIGRLTAFQALASDRSEKLTVGITMYGVTTPCVNAVKERLAQECYESLVFHATGVGRKAMDGFIEMNLYRLRRMSFVTRNKG